ncbi:transglutaminase family protein [Propionicicella superfundia]|uniref:transglutaminase family protein n=1 Tax=Propionicicella superfundia TaxID=348582 RepID=UPI0003F8BBAA|nr:transglutaminase family protein [Propionicicella superfundia]
MSAEHDTPRTYLVRHRTVYTYDGTVDAAYERGFLRHRDTDYQTVLEHRIVVEPEPDALSEHVDFFGNHSYYVEVLTDHSVLEVSEFANIRVERTPVDLGSLNRWTVASAAAEIAESSELDAVERTAFLLPSDLVELAPAVSAYAEPILGPDRPLGDAVEGLIHAIYRDFRYEQGVTSVRTSLPELLDLRAGVCQDFAHLAVGCLRSVGLPARYVSGHVETSPPPGGEKLEGSDASHAWAGVLTPTGLWVDLDPTNDHLVDSRYLTTAWGRDFRDVSPLKGVIYTEAKESTLKVGVDVIRLPESDDPPPPPQ